MTDANALWNRYCKYLAVCPTIDLSLDISRMRFEDGFLERMSGPMARAFSEMNELEKGAVANGDEGRMVGHYWLRDAALAPSAELRDAITRTQTDIVRFAKDVHGGKIAPARGARFANLLVIGIGGSALGPQFVASALGGKGDVMRPFFFDNTDPDGMRRTLDAFGDRLGQTLTVVISKSGATKETRNGMLEARAAYQDAGLPFERHAVAVTGEGSLLDRTAKQEEWLATFPMWDWVGGRTSELSAVGLLPAALQGIPVDELLSGARDADVVTRRPHVAENPAALLALMWHYAGEGRGKKAMVILPYKDRLELFSRYLQQLVMESLGKERDRQGRIVHQGLVVYGNKGSTDQHAYVQQLRDGIDNFFVTFVRVLSPGNLGARAPLEVEPGITSADYLDGFLLGTRQALYENGRDSLTLTLAEVNARSIGALIAVYERAVGLYASLVDVNAYHQPGVEAGKKAAARVIELQGKILDLLATAKGEGLDAQQVAERLGAPAEVETVQLLLERLSVDPARRVEVMGLGSNAATTIGRTHPAAKFRRQ
ncbi:MAG TPA: glucose-6-phosphate isomerase [Polyangiaceae bacterium]|jgi:glucose-6-phosphate isomerase|nr:glucose-6-phosphate isomerase [Polyangiaceae bacterium]